MYTILNLVIKSMDDNYIVEWNAIALRPRHFFNVASSRCIMIRCAWATELFKRPRLM